MYETNEKIVEITSNPKSLQSKLFHNFERLKANQNSILSLIDCPQESCRVLIFDGVNKQNNILFKHQSLWKVNET